MTTLICNFQDIVGAKIKGAATLSAGEIRVGVDAPAVVLNRPSDTLELVEGQVTFTNVEPGYTTLVLTTRGHSTNFKFTVPNSPETVYLSDCVEQVLEYTPAVVNRGLDQIEGARDEALGLVEVTVDEALDSRVAPLEGLRAVLRRSLGMASKASKQLTVIERDFSQIQGEFAGVTDSRSLMLRALHAATTARKRVLALTEQLNDKPSRGELQQAISTLTHELSTMEARLNTKLNQKADK